MSERLGDTAPALTGTDLIDIQIRGDGYTAALFVPEEADTFPSPKQVHLAIENAGVNYGIDDSIIDKLIEEKIKGEWVVFARGKSAVGGGGSKLIWHDKSGSEASPRDVTEEIASPARERYLFMAVEEGQPILSKLLGTEGESGINVFGASTAVPGDDMPLPESEGTYISKDGLTLLAGKPGVAAWADAKLSVMEVHHIKGNVDAQTGNVKVDGSVYIEKDIRSQFRVEAIGDIYIGGIIEGADVYSHGGSVIVRNGIVGQGQARILAGRNILAGFIQDAIVGAKQDVEAEGYIFNSAVTAGRYITAVSDEGIVRGGTLFAEKRIEVRSAGSEDRIVTELKVGYTPPVDISWARYQIRHDRRQNRLKLANIQKRLAFLRLLKERIIQLSDDKEGQLAELERKERILLGQYRDQSTQEAKIVKRAGEMVEEELKAETIRVHDTIYPEVSVAIGQATMEMDQERHDVIFFRSGDRLAFGPLSQVLEKKA